MFGGQLGYNWQTGNWVFGIEGDVDGYGARNSTHTTGTPTLAVAFTASEAPKSLASARGRVGYAWGPGLIYITVGGAWANMAFNTTDALGVSSITATKSGWTLGGGYEWMFAPNWSLRAEYLDYMFNSGATTATVFPPPGGGAITHTWSGANVQIARVGLNYKFDWGGAESRRRSLGSRRRSGGSRGFGRAGARRRRSDLDRGLSWRQRRLGLDRFQ